MIGSAARVASAPAGGFAVLDGEDVYRIPGVDRMPAFFLSVPSDTDLWMFVTSRGGITAGRVDADGAIFPYEPVDRLHDGHRHTGPVTLLRVRHESGDRLWEPLSDRSVEDPLVERSLCKNVTGNAVTFEEVHHGLGLSFRYRWSAADGPGLVRTATLSNHGPSRVTVDLIDGLRNVLPHGAPLALYQNASSLVDAYKRADLDPGTRLATVSLTARIVDRAEASESLRASTVWCAGLPGFRVTLDADAVEAFRRGEEIPVTEVLTGRRGNYLVAGSLSLEPGASVRWHLAADAARSHGDIAAIRARIRRGEDLPGWIERSLAEATESLRRIVAGADGIQLTADDAVSAHHFTNVLFNSLRGGVFTGGHEVPTGDFRRFVAARNRDAADRRDAFLRGLPDPIPAPDLVAAAGATGDPVLHRLALEYLPIGFGRRHGDPSRPWNRFTIRVRNADGGRALHYEGNWRDIFQNWEALAYSFPRFLPNFVAIFLNASTVDGFNPYRITRDGVDWETEDPDDPWSYIGYWGDHQIVYLLRLLEALDRFSPGALEEMLDRRIFAYADVPYRIAPFREILRNPRATIRFDAARQRAVEERVASLGADGRLVPDGAGGVLHVALLEKLLVPALSKLSNLVPGGGIWMNTQRPEWNDANNALAGEGLSVVTMGHLRRYLDFLATRLGDADGSADVSTEVVAWLRALDGIVGDGKRPCATPGDRARWMTAAGEAFSEYRAAVYARGFAGTTMLAIRSVADFCRRAREMLDREIAGQRRGDGLYHAYNLLELRGGSAGVRPLDEMLEGQVAALSSGAVGAEEAIELLTELFEGPLYREDQGSFLLYPERELPAFLERNVVPEEEALEIPLLRDMLRDGDGSVVSRDADGVLRFHADLASARDLETTLDRLADGADGARWGDRPRADRTATLALYETVFDHRSFTGRSGRMYGYEGLGCIYWHMVSKLLLAVQEIAWRADRAGEPASVRRELAEAYYRIRDGLGFRKTPAEYGAFPTDPYSHTPRHAGAQQPGMTGQVKEEILTRLGELGVRVRGGALRFHPVLLRRGELLDAPRDFLSEDPRGGRRTMRVPAGGLAFTFCQVPVIYERGERSRIRVIRRDGSPVEIAGDTLPPEAARPIFDRSGDVERIEVTIPGEILLP